DRLMNINLSKTAINLQETVNLVSPCLLVDFNGRAVQRYIFNGNPQSLAKSQPTSRTENKEHSVILLSRQSKGLRHYVAGKDWLFLIADCWHVYEVVIPLAGIKFLAFFIDSRSHNHLCRLDVLTNR